MVVDTTAAFPAGASIRAALDGQVAEARYVAAGELAEVLFGDEQYATCCWSEPRTRPVPVPISPDAVERAIELNGVAVERNRQAFRQGRRAVVADTETDRRGRALAGAPTPALSRAAGRVRGGVRAEGELGRLLDIRIPELVAYQDEAYAERYARFVEQVRSLEQQRVPGSTELAEAVARNLFTLMAYKYEYEVARLCLDPALDAGVRDRFGPGSRISYRLHPPVLRAMGMQRKISLGP